MTDVPSAHLLDGDGLHGDGRIRLDDVDIHAIRSALHRGRRDGYDLRQGLKQQPDVDVLSRPQRDYPGWERSP